MWCNQNALIFQNLFKYTVRHSTIDHLMRDHFQCCLQYLTADTSGIKVMWGMMTRALKSSHVIYKNRKRYLNYLLFSLLEQYSGF